MLLNTGEKIFVAHRRLFEKDSTRFFVGVVDGYEAGVIRTTGHSYVRDNISGAMLEKADERTKLFSIASGTLLCYVLPGDVELSSLRFVERDGRLMLLDGKELAINLADSSRNGLV